MNTAPTQTPKALPPGWRWVRLGEFCETTSGGTPSRGVNAYYGGDIPWVKSGELNDCMIDCTEEKITKEAIENSSAKIFPSGTLLIALYGATVGKLGILKIDAATNQAVCAIFTNELIDRDYLFFYLLQERKNLIIISTGGAQPNINQEIVRDIKIPLPPLSEQKRIAGVLNEQMAGVEKARAAAQAQLEAAKSLPAAYLRQVFNSSEAEQWPTKKVSELCSQIDYGYTASADFTISDPHFLRITDIQNGRVVWDQVPGCRINDKDEMANCLIDGDIVFARTGATTGKSFLIRKPPRSVFASYLIRLRPKDGVMADFLYAFFQSDDYWKQIRAKARGGAQPNVNATLLGAIELRIPALPKQKIIVSRLKEQMGTINQIQEGITKEFESISCIPASLLRLAFNGEL